jgi:hypothetical protein
LSSTVIVISLTFIQNNSFDISQYCNIHALFFPHISFFLLNNVIKYCIEIKFNWNYLLFKNTNNRNPSMVEWHVQASTWISISICHGIFVFNELKWEWEVVVVFLKLITITVEDNNLCYLLITCSCCQKPLWKDSLNNINKKNNNYFSLSLQFIEHKNTMTYANGNPCTVLDMSLYHGWIPINGFWQQEHVINK